MSVENPPTAHASTRPTHTTTTFTTTDNIHVPDHAADQWTARFPDDDRSPAVAWRDATPARSNRAPRLSAKYARVDPKACAVLLVLGDTLLTVLYVAKEPAGHQERYVRAVPGLTHERIREQARRIDAGEIPLDEELQSGDIVSVEPGIGR